jgi:hypothetical protein
VPAQIDPPGIDEFLLGQVVSGCEHVIHFTEKTFLKARIIDPTAQRGIHHDNPRLPKSTGRLIVVRRRFLPSCPSDPIAEAAENPNDRRVPAARLRHTDVRRQITHRRLEPHGLE